MNTALRTINPADIIFSTEKAVPLPPPTNAKLDMETIDHSIYQMLGNCGASNGHDRLIIAIKALIEAGLNTRPQIIAAAMRNGFGRKHAAVVLAKSEGSNPRRDQWQRDEAGVYHVHVAVEVDALTG